MSDGINAMDDDPNNEYEFRKKTREFYESYYLQGRKRPREAEKQTKEKEHTKFISRADWDVMREGRWAREESLRKEINEKLATATEFPVTVDFVAPGHVTYGSELVYKLAEELAKDGWNAYSDVTRVEKNGTTAYIITIRYPGDYLHILHK